MSISVRKECNDKENAMSIVDHRSDIRGIAQAVNDLRAAVGVGTVILEPSNTTTLLRNVAITPGAFVSLQATTATAAAAVSALYVDAPIYNGVVTIHHDSTSDTDRAFRYVVLRESR